MLFYSVKYLFEAGNPVEIMVVAQFDFFKLFDFLIANFITRQSYSASRLYL